MKKRSVPKSKAKTAYGLLSEVRRLILEEPKRYYQGAWGLRGKAVRDRGFVPPACGTVACVAGWVSTLKAPDAPLNVATGARAATILGIDYDQHEELFSGIAVLHDEYQSVGYARAGARHIARFQKKYAKQLKAKAV